MPYKTKFRKIKYPAKDLGLDANSVRSVGAYFYERLKEYPPRILHAKSKTLADIFRKMANSYSHDTEIVKYAIRSMGGAQKAAKKADDEKSYAYFSRALDKIKPMGV